MLYNLFFFGALERISASRTALVVALNPVLTALMLALVLRQKLELHRWIGIATALLGVCVVLARGDLSALSSRITTGEALMIRCEKAEWELILYLRPLLKTAVPTD